MINRLLDGWTSDADVNAIERICNSVNTAQEMRTIYYAISPRETSISDIGQRIKVRIALGRTP